MPQTTKNAKKQQEKATHAQSIKLHQFRLAPPTASAGPTLSASAASTLLISSTGSDVDERNPIANSPDAILILDTSDVENEDDGYRPDDIMSEMDGDKLKESLQLQMQGEIEVLEQSHWDAKKSSTYQVLMREIKPD